MKYADYDPAIAAELSALNEQIERGHELLDDARAAGNRTATVLAQLSLLQLKYRRDDLYRKAAQ